MAEYKVTLIRNGLIAIIISSLIIGVTFYGSGALANHVKNNLGTSSSGLSTSSVTVSSSVTSSQSPASSSTLTTTTTKESSFTSTVTVTDSPTTMSSGCCSSSRSSSSSLSQTSSSITSSSTIASTSATSIIQLSTSAGGVTFVSFANVSACCAIYNSVNKMVYAQSENALLAILDGTVQSAIPGKFAQAPYSLTYDTQNGTVFADDPGFMPHNGCTFAGLSQVSGENASGPSMSYLQGLTGPLVFDPLNGYVYLATGGSGAEGVCPVGLQIIDTTNSTKGSIGFIPTGPQPSRFSLLPESINAIALDTANGNVFVPVANTSTTFYNESDVNTNTTVYTVVGTSVDNSSIFTLPGRTVEMLFDQSNSYLYCEQLSNATYSNFKVTSGTYSLFAVNTLSNTIAGGITLSSSAPLVFDSKNNNLYAMEQNQILEIDGISVRGAYLEPISTIVSAAVYDQSGDEILVFTTQNNSSETSSSSSTSQSPPNTIATLPVSLTRNLVYDQLNHAIYGISPNYSDIVEINGTTNQLITSIAFPCGSPSYLAFDSGDNLLYALINGNDPTNCSNTNSTLISIDPANNSVISTSSLSGAAGQMIFDSRDGTLYVEETNSSNYAVLAAFNATNEETIGQTDVSGYPGLLPVIWGNILYDPVNNLLYLEWSTPSPTNNFFAGTIVNGSTGAIVGSFDPVSGDMPPSQMAYNPENGLVYVAQAGSSDCLGVSDCPYNAGNSISVINGTSSVAPISVSPSTNSTLGSIAYLSSGGGSIYVTNTTVGSSLLSITVINASNDSVSGVYDVAEQVNALFVNQANPSLLYVVTPSSVYVMKVN